MLRARGKAQGSRRKLRRLLSEQLENRQLMAGDVMQWSPIPAHLIAVPQSTYAVSGSFSSLANSPMYGLQATSFVGGVAHDEGEPIAVGQFDLSQVMPASAVLTGKRASASSVNAKDDGRIEVGQLDLNNLPKDGSFGGTAGNYSNFDLDEPIVVGEVELSDVVTVDLTALSSVTADDQDRIEVGQLDLDNLPKDGSFGRTVEIAVIDSSEGDYSNVDLDEPIVVGEFELSDVVTVDLTALSSVTADDQDRIEVGQLDLDNLPTDGSFGRTVEIAVVDLSEGDYSNVDQDEPIAVGEFELSDVVAVDLTALSSVTADDQDRIEVGQLDLDNLPTDGSFGRTVEIAVVDLSEGDYSNVDQDEPIAVGEVQLSDVVTVDLTALSSVTADDQDRIEVGQLDLDNLPTDGSFGRTVEVAVVDSSEGDYSNVDLDEPIAVGEVQLSDVVTVDLTALSSVTADDQDRIEVGQLDLDNLPTDGSFGRTVEVAVVDSSEGDYSNVDLDEPIAVGEVELSDVVTVDLTALSSVTADDQDRIEVGQLDLDNLPADGSFGRTVEVAMVDLSEGDYSNVDLGEAIAVGEVELSQVVPVSADLNSKEAAASLLNASEGDRIEVGQAEVKSLLQVTSFRKATDLAMSQYAAVAPTTPWVGDSSLQKRTRDTLRVELVDSLLNDLFGF